MTSNLCKVLEKLVRRKLIQFLISENLMPQNQHGFMDGLSTETQLVDHLDHVLTLLMEHDAVDVINLDQSKAFDRLPHLLLIEHLRSIGIGGNVLQWLKAFLMGREQRVRVGETLSEPVLVTSGVHSLS